MQYLFLFYSTKFQYISLIWFFKIIFIKYILNNNLTIQIISIITILLINTCFFVSQYNSIVAIVKY